jgi:hypothetical protein
VAKGSRWRSSSCRRAQDDEGVMLEVNPADDVAGWTLIASSFVGHRNILNLKGL